MIEDVILSILFLAVIVLVMAAITGVCTGIFIGIGVLIDKFILVNVLDAMVVSMVSELKVINFSFIAVVALLIFMKIASRAFMTHGIE